MDQRSALQGVGRPTVALLSSLVGTAVRSTSRPCQSQAGPCSPVRPGLLWVQLGVRIQECQEAAQTPLSQIQIFP